MVLASNSKAIIDCYNKKNSLNISIILIMEDILMFTSVPNKKIVF